jgi:hypothetical protein
MIDFVSEGRIVVAERVVGELRQVHDRIETFEIELRQLPHVTRDNRWARSAVLEQPTSTIQASVDPERAMSALQEFAAKYGADIAVCSGV